MRVSRRAALGFGAGLLLPGAAAARPARPLPPVPAENIVVEAQPFDHFDLQDRGLRRFGALRFLSGMVLRSSSKLFGGLSSLRVKPDGRFLCASDVGCWLAGRIAYDAQGAMTGLAETRMAPMLGPSGRQLRETGQWDTEAIAEAPDGTVYVGVERSNDIVRFDFGREGFSARGRPLRLPPSLTRLPSNKGIEALGVMPARSRYSGALIAIAERAFGQSDDTLGALVGGPQPGDFRVARHDEFDVSDLAFLPDGDLLILERRFRWRDGVANRIRRVPLADIRPRARLDGALVFEATMRQDTDNLEGLSVHRNAADETILTLVSDDNFSWLQRTLMLQFRYVG